MEIDWGWNSMYHVVLENPHFELTPVECFNHTRQRDLLFKKICQTWCKSQPWIITTAPFIEVLLFLFCMTGHHHGEWEEEGLLKETGGEEGEGAGLVVLDVTSQLNHGAFVPIDWWTTLYKSATSTPWKMFLTSTTIA